MRADRSSAIAFALLLGVAGGAVAADRSIPLAVADAGLAPSENAAPTGTGTTPAMPGSLAGGRAPTRRSSRLDPDLQELVQASILFLAVAVLTWMILWMHRNAAGLGGELRRKADQALVTGRLMGLATIAFVAVFREGLETVLFLWGVLVQRADLTALPFVAAGLGGAALAVATAWLFFRGFRFLSLQRFFRVTGLLLLPWRA